SVRPGDDFFAYANGEWLKATAIPAGRDRWTARTAIDDVTRQQILSVFDAAATAPTGSLSRMIADFRSAYENEALIEARGLAPLQPQLDRIAGIHDRAALARRIGADLGTDVDPLNWGIYRSSHVLGLSVEPSIHGEKTYVAFLLQGGLGLEGGEAYAGTAPTQRELRDRYVAYIARLLTLAGFTHAAERAQAVLALETALAQSQATPEASANDHNADSVWAAADFAQRAPGMDWGAFFAAAGLAQLDSLVPWQPGAIRGLAAQVTSQPLEVWKDYLRFHLLDRYADVLPRAFADAALAFREVTPGRTRAQRALEATQMALSEAVGRLYAERYFPAGQKGRVQAIVANVVAAFSRRVATVTWMSARTRTLALAKLRTLYVGVGYPDRWADDGDLTIDPGDAAGNLRRIADRSYRHTVARLGQPVDPRAWLISPQTVGAILVFQQNTYDFSAALLQPPKFDSTASEAAAYGAIGAVIGHDVTHFVDVLGAEYETDGRERRWWTAEDSAGFAAAASPLVDQVSGYRPFPDLTLNGTATRTENVADLGGLAAAFDAYRAALGTRSVDTAYVRQQDRQFFLAFARSWRAKLSDGALRAQVTAGDHAPDQYRVAIVRNFDAWYDAFDVRPGDRLYLAPAQRVRIW
ncbi:MAG TPA: M13 family metallopeptidase, partial [Gemmatimonadales bacterium]|nr:M13 family metallopeptidase [Gemmatimonadales bacterium]